MSDGRMVVGDRILVVVVVAIVVIAKGNCSKSITMASLFLQPVQPPPHPIHSFALRGSLGGAVSSK
jgi:hypothetical protein